MEAEQEDFERLTNDILKFSSLGIRPGLERVSRLLSRLGSPERKFRAIQVLGTNGKGSTAATIESVCMASGMRTALYTSPHLVSLRERLRVCGAPLSLEKWRGALRRVVSAADSDEVLQAGRPTFFENLTAICFLLMSESNLDIAVVEAGMGGRYDATSACGAIAAVITPIGMDHIEYLGDTIEAIASEKFAAVRGGAAAFYAADDGRLSVQFAEACKSAGAGCFLMSRVAASSNIRCSLGGTTFDYVPLKPELGVYAIPGLKTPLVGIHQAYNASNAITSLLSLRKIFPGCFGGVGEREIRRGLLSVDWPGRMEVFRKSDSSPVVILDGAHNEHGFRALLVSLASLMEAGESSGVGAVVFAVMKDKNAAPILERLKELGAPVFCTRPPMERAMPARDLARIVSDAGCEARSYEDPIEALEAALAAARPEETVVCCGSLFLVGALRRRLAHENVFHEKN
ncbi:MAG: bifunctional folylpolyglutamate synthase/dihydrofolate synthase [Synergistaceae bacterium]|jgi:dihydrofolate synthase/folylpolyglutamate synthase|nr:bifunctional folylpolyglutamate synthase/dihydrofolate synthase [Synergistaceae bacterium]